MCTIREREFALHGLRFVPLVGAAILAAEGKRLPEGIARRLISEGGVALLRSTEDAVASMWMVRAGRNAVSLDEFLDESIVAIGFGEASDLPLGATKDQVTRRVGEALGGHKSGAQANFVGQIYRFLSEIRAGDHVCTSDPAQRRYCLGRVLEGDGVREGSLPRYRRVEWTHHVSRDQLTARSRNSLGAIMTLFLVPEQVRDEMLSKAVELGQDLGEDAPPVPGAKVSAEESAVDGSAGESFDDIATRAAELIEDAIVQLDWDEVQDVVAGVLRGMGYQSLVAAKGADRGVDIFASPDGLGLEEPRIFVEVKHRPRTTMGAPEVRAFLGGRQAGDKCLYVSTGGFTREARYEAERSAIPVTLIDLPRLRQLLVEQYGRLDAATTALVPLQHLYWPAT